MNKEFLIHIKDLDDKYVDNLIVSLVRAGYSVYFDFEHEHIIFNGHIDEVCPNLTLYQ